MSAVVTRGRLSRADLALWDGKNATVSRLDASGGTVTALAIGNHVDVLQVFGGGSSRSRLTIVAALSYINTTAVTLIFAPGVWSIDDDLTIPSNFTCYIPRGCVFSVDSGKTLTFQGALQRESNSWYTGSGLVGYEPNNNVIVHTNELFGSYLPGHLMSYIPWAEHADILAGTSTYNASSDVQDWLDDLSPNMEATILGGVVGQGAILVKDDIRFVGGGWLKPVSNASPATILQVGNDATDTAVVRLGGHLNIGDRAGSVSTWSNITGLSLVRCTGFDFSCNFRGLGVAFAGLPTESAVAYGKVSIGELTNSKIGIRLAPSGDGYTNQIRFKGGRFALFSGNYESGCIYIDIQAGGTNRPNSIVFESPSLEGPAQYLKNAGEAIVIERARFEPGVSGTAGTDFAATFIEHLSGSSRCEIGFAYNSQWLSGNHTINHGAGTRVDDLSFTIAGIDLRTYFYPGSWAYVTISGTTYLLPVRGSTFSTDTTVLVTLPLISGNPTAIVTGRVKDSGSQNILALERNDIPSVSSMRSVTYQDALLWLSRCVMTLTARGGDHPGLTIGPGGSASDKALSITDFDAETLSATCQGFMQVTRFGVAKTPVATQTTISDPTGGATIDTQSRAAINDIIDVLQAFGLVA